jgi:hypothetical protein
VKAAADKTAIDAGGQGSSVFEQPKLPGLVDGVAAVFDAKLLEDVPEMALHSLDGQGKFAGDFLVGESFSQKLQSIKLAVRERLDERLGFGRSRFLLARDHGLLQRGLNTLLSRKPLLRPGVLDEFGHVG